MTSYEDNFSYNESLFIHFCKNTIRNTNNTLDLILKNCKINFGDKGGYSQNFLSQILKIFVTLTWI